MNTPSNDPNEAPAPMPCCPVLEAPLSAQEAEATAQAFRALGEPTRLRLVSLIAANPDGEMCVCNLVEPLGLSQPTVSHHLKVLVEAGILQRERRGSWAYFRIDRGRLAAVRAALDAPAPTPAIAGP